MSTSGYCRVGDLTVKSTPHLCLVRLMSNKGMTGKSTKPQVELIIHTNKDAKA